MCCLAWWNCTSRSFFITASGDRTIPMTLPVLIISGKLIPRALALSLIETLVFEANEISTSNLSRLYILSSRAAWYALSAFSLGLSAGARTAKYPKGKTVDIAVYPVLPLQ